MDPMRLMMPAATLFGTLFGCWLVAVPVAGQARLGVLTAATAQSTEYRTENVIVVVLDGIRFAESFGDPSRRLIPNMAGELARQGVLNTSFYNDGHTRTVSGHASILTGVWERHKNSYSSKPRADHPTLFEYWRKQRGGGKDEALLASSKRKLKGLAHSHDPNYGGDYGARTNTGGPDWPVMTLLTSGYRDDDDTFDELIDELREHRPRVVLVNLREPDTAAHRGHWEEYLAAIQNCDRLVAELWKTLQADPFYAGKTTLLVTNDHGRHGDERGGFQDHGDDCDGCRHIFLMGLGPDFSPGRSVTTRRTQIDIVPTLGALLGIDVGQADGQVMRELLQPKESLSALQRPFLRRPLAPVLRGQ